MSFLVHHVSGAVPYSQIVFVRAVVSSFVLLPAISLADLNLRRPATSFLILRGLAGSVALCSYFWTLANTSVGNARILADLAPLLVAVLGWLLLKERLSPRQVAAIACGVVGSGGG
ncbi:MAG: DMT family transporter [Chloroflexaceae bacterium]|nr:DMT family transporter [Chloroflexaceae bacterium]